MAGVRGWGGDSRRSGAAAGSLLLRALRWAAVRRSLHRLAITLAARISATSPSATPIGSLYTSASSILAPISTRISARPYLSSRNRCAMSASRKYSARRPRMANMFDVNTMNGSPVMA